MLSSVLGPRSPTLVQVFFCLDSATKGNARIRARATYHDLSSAILCVRQVGCLATCEMRSLESYPAPHPGRIPWVACGRRASCHSFDLKFNMLLFSQVWQPLTDYASPAKLPPSVPRLADAGEARWTRRGGGEVYISSTCHLGAR